ncbi:MAG: hypothetical protein ABSG91_18340 [Syntrophobacteraceae bacterium]
MKEYVIYPLVIGANETDQGIMTYLRGYGKRIWIPVYAFLIKGGKRLSWWIPGSSSSSCRNMWDGNTA